MQNLVELVNVIAAFEERATTQQLSKDTAD